MTVPMIIGKTHAPQRDGHPVADRRLALPVLCLALALAAGVWPNGFFETTRNWLFDTDQRLAPAARPAGQTVIIDIDTESIRRIGQWPWSREQLARLVDAASGARAIGLDLLLVEPDRLSPEHWAAAHPALAPEVGAALRAMPSTDQTLVASLSRAPVVMAALTTALPETEPLLPLSTSPIVESGPDPRPALPRFSGVIRPLPVLAGAASGLGVVSVPLEPDGVLRRIPAVLAVGDNLTPGFGIELVRVALGAGPIMVKSDWSGAAAVEIGDRSVPTDRRGRVWLRYADPAALRVVPAYEVLDHTADPTLFRQRIVLIGASAPGLADVVATPLRRSLSGVAVQAQFVDSVLAGDALWRPAWAEAAELLMSTALGLAAALLLRRVQRRVYGAAFAGVFAALVAGAFLAFRLSGMLLDWTFPMAALTVTGLAALAGCARREIQFRRAREVELAEALMQARAADRAKTEFLANVSHELRTPLSAIMGFSEVMSLEVIGQLPRAYRDYAGDIHRSGTHLLALIDDLLNLSVVELGGTQAGADRIGVAALIEECGRMASARIAARHIHLAHEVSPNLPTLIADARMVRQMIVNLLSNAVKHSPENAEVHMCAALDGGWLRLAVRDHGPGIAAEDLPYAMTRFGRLRSARLAQDPGIGIGLPLTKSLVELHGGRLAIESDVGVGTQAMLYFPPSRLVYEEPQL